MLLPARTGFAEDIDAGRIMPIRDQLSGQQPQPEPLVAPMPPAPVSPAGGSAKTDETQNSRIDILEKKVDRLERSLQQLQGGGNIAGGRPGAPPNAQGAGAPARTGKRLPMLVAECASGCTVSDANDLNFVSRYAKPGSVITIAPGVYPLAKGIRLQGEGTGKDQKPITLRAERLGLVQIESRAVMAFKVAGANWVIENLDIKGVCADHSFCEHAFQIFGSASNTVIRNNRMRDFNAAIKGGGTEEGEFANDVLIEGNHIFNASIRATGTPVTPVDINGGKRWKLIDNYIADFAKGKSDQVSYAAFLKSNSMDGLFERNLVICEWKFPGGTRVGLSFGGGGTFKQSTCQDQNCSVFHTNGVMRNNIVMNCSDVGIYLNKSKAAKIYNNTLVATSGIDGMSAETTAMVENNIVYGAIRERKGAAITQKNNVLDGMFAGKLEFTNPAAGDLTVKTGGALLMQGELPPEVTADFCGNPRTPAAARIGAIAYGSGNCSVTARIARALEGMTK